ncbi:MAG TPA: vWA domain-containing protein [Acidimicrobiales bacterium]
MSHTCGSVITLPSAVSIGPAVGELTHEFQHQPAGGAGTLFLILHFTSVSIPAGHELRVNLGYDTDVFTAADGSSFWTRPINIHHPSMPPGPGGGRVPVSWVAPAGATTGSAQIDRYGRGEQTETTHQPDPGEPSSEVSRTNPDFFLVNGTYEDPIYNDFWFCHEPPLLQNVRCVANQNDVRRRVARSVGVIVSVEPGHMPGDPEIVSTCSVTLVEPNVVVTAGHCIEIPGGSGLAGATKVALASSVSFDFETECNFTVPAGYNPVFHKVTRLIKYRMDFNPFDYALLEIEVPPAGLGIPPVDMRNDLPAINEEVFGVHHPNAAVKKISPPAPAFDRTTAVSPFIKTDEIDVSGGSSGSGLFDTAGRIVGVLSHQDADDACHLRYCPTAALIDDLPSGPGDPPITRDVVLVLDRSGSMSELTPSGQTKMAAASQAVSLFVELIRASTGNRLGMVSFSTQASAQPDFPLQDVTPASKASFLAPGGPLASLTAGGATSIGSGLQVGAGAFTAGANLRSILLLTDGLQNTDPMIAAVEGQLAGMEVNAVGFGSEANLNGALLTQLTQSHDGLYHRAASSLHLKKFFALAFGNIFESGQLVDPEGVVSEREPRAKDLPFQVCGEEAITAIVGWDDLGAQLRIELVTPTGVVVDESSPTVESSSGTGWTFLRVPLAFGGERDGEWNVRVHLVEGGREKEQHYFVNVNAFGGPQLTRPMGSRRYYTGATVNPVVRLRFRDRSIPHHADVSVTVTRPERSLGRVLTATQLAPPTTVDGDAVSARHATIAAIEAGPGLQLGEAADTFQLFDDGYHRDGLFEHADGVFGNPLEELLTVEGNYTFAVRAEYGEPGCRGTRELVWALQVDVGVDPGNTDLTVGNRVPRPDGRDDVVITIFPRDRYGNPLGPGRADDLSVGGFGGTTGVGPVRDNGDGSYSVDAVLDPTTGIPEVSVAQPGRDPVVVGASGGGGGGGWPWSGCAPWMVALALVILVAVVVLVLLLVL